MSQMARRLTLVLLCGLALASCSAFNQQEPTPPGGKASTPAPGTDGLTPTGAGQATTPTTEGAYPPPGHPTAAPGAPTAQPSAGGPLVGPEWTILYSGDLNGDGAADVVAVKPAAGVTPNPVFQQPQYANFKGPAEALVIVQANPSGQPYVQLEGTRVLLRASGNTLTTFTNAAGHMARVNAGRQPQLDIQAIDSNGAPIGRVLGLVWNPGTGSYAIYSAPAK